MNKIKSKNNKDTNQYVMDVFNQGTKKVNEDLLKGKSSSETILLNSDLKIRETILHLYEFESKNDSKLKKTFAIIILIILIGQLIITYTIFILIGLKILKFSELTINILISATLLETYGLINVILKYLFNHDLKQLLLNILDYPKKRSLNKEQKSR